MVDSLFFGIGCYGEGGMDPIYVPVKKEGVQLKVFKYLLDCQEKTVDRKSDIADADGGIKKAWMNISNDPTAIYAYESYCPIISTLPKQ